MAAKDKIAPTLLGLAVAANYAVHKTGWADTVCINGRRLFHTNHPAGKAAAVVAGLTFAGWFLPHFVNGPLMRSDASD